MIEDGIDRILAAMHDIEHAIGQARFAPQIVQKIWRGGITL